MQPRTTGILLLAALAVGAFIYFYEIRGEDARLDAEERGKRLFRDVEAADLDWIEFDAADAGPLRLEQNEGVWRIVRPVDFAASDDAARLAETLTTLGSESSFESEQPESEFGLDPASARSLRFGAGDRSFELRVGRETPVGSGNYARSGGSPKIHTIADYRARALEHSLFDLRAKQVVDFDRDAVRRIDASWPGGRVVLERVGESRADGAVPGAGWRMRTPLDAAADDEAVDALLGTLSFLEAKAFVDAPGDAERALFDPPDFALTLHGAGGGEHPLALSRLDAEGRRFARSGGDVLFEIDAERIADFPRKTAAYRERKLASFPTTAARHVDFFFQSEGGDPVSISARRGAEGWSSEPEAFAPGALSRLVSELSRLEAEDILAESMGEKELEALGLSPANAVLTVLGEAPATGEAGGDAAGRPPLLAEIQLGQVTPEGIAARSAGSPIVYRLPLELSEQIPVSYAAFQSRFRAGGEVEDDDPLPGEVEGDSGLPPLDEESP